MPKKSQSSVNQNLRLSIAGFRGLNTEIMLPEQCILTGPNGSGKTTLLHAISLAASGKPASGLQWNRDDFAAQGRTWSIQLESQRFGSVSCSFNGHSLSQTGTLNVFYPGFDATSQSAVHMLCRAGLQLLGTRGDAAGDPVAAIAARAHVEEAYVAQLLQGSQDLASIVETLAAERDRLRSARRRLPAHPPRTQPETIAAKIAALQAKLTPLSNLDALRRRAQAALRIADSMREDLARSSVQMPNKPRPSRRSDPQHALSMLREAETKAKTLEIQLDILDKLIRSGACPTCGAPTTANVTAKRASIAAELEEANAEVAAAADALAAAKRNAELHAAWDAYESQLPVIEEKRRVLAQLENDALAAEQALRAAEAAAKESASVENIQQELAALSKQHQEAIAQAAGHQEYLSTDAAVRTIETVLAAAESLRNEVHSAAWEAVALFFRSWPANSPVRVEIGPAGPKVFYNGVPFRPEDLSAGQTLLFTAALGVAICAGLGNGIVLLDNLEALDADHSSAMLDLLTVAKRSGVPLIAATSAPDAPLDFAVPIDSLVTNSQPSNHRTATLF